MTIELIRLTSIRMFALIRCIRQNKNVLAHLAADHDSLWYGAASVVCPESNFSF